MLCISLSYIYTNIIDDFSFFSLKIRDVLNCEAVIRHFAKSEHFLRCLIQKWDVLKELKTALHLPYMTTVQLQNRDFTLSDFYGCTKLIDMKLTDMINNESEKYTTIFENLRQCINDRTHPLLENPFALCTIFLDPRYKCDIDRNEEKLQLVEITLGRLWNKIRIARTGVIPVKNNDEPANLSGDANSLFNELDSQYESELGLRSNEINGAARPNYSVKPSELTKQIDKYKNATANMRIKSSESVHKFWECKKTEFGNEIFEIASVLLAVPPTQAEVERCFSALKFIFTAYRYNLKEDLLESLLLVHLNPDLYYLVRSNDLKQNFNDHN